MTTMTGDKPNRSSTDRVKLILANSAVKGVALLGSILALFALVARLGFAYGEVKTELQAAKERLQRNESEMIQLERTNQRDHAAIMESLGRIEERIEQR